MGRCLQERKWEFAKAISLWKNSSKSTKYICSCQIIATIVAMEKLHLTESWFSTKIWQQNSVFNILYFPIYHKDHWNICGNILYFPMCHKDYPLDSLGSVEVFWVFVFQKKMTHLKKEVICKTWKSCLVLQNNWAQT